MTETFGGHYYLRLSIHNESIIFLTVFFSCINSPYSLRQTFIVRSALDAEDSRIIRP